MSSRTPGQHWAFINVQVKTLASKTEVQSVPVCASLCLGRRLRLKLGTYLLLVETFPRFVTTPTSDDRLPRLLRTIDPPKPPCVPNFLFHNSPSLYIYLCLRNTRLFLCHCFSFLQLYICWSRTTDFLTHHLSQHHVKMASPRKCPLTLHSPHSATCSSLKNALLQRKSVPPSLICSRSTTPCSSRA